MEYCGHERSNATWRGCVCLRGLLLGLDRRRPNTRIDTVTGDTLTWLMVNFGQPSRPGYSIASGNRLHLVADWPPFQPIDFRCRRHGPYDGELS